MLSMTDVLNGHDAIIMVNAMINLVAKVSGILIGARIVVRKDLPVSEASGTITGALALDAAFALLNVGHPLTHWSVVVILTGIADDLMTTLSRIFGQAITEHNNPKRVRG